MNSKLEVICNLKTCDVSFDSESVTLAFENGTNLVVYNKYNIHGPVSNNQNDLLGTRVDSVEENESFISIKFENKLILKVDFRDEAYNGPEAMQLRLPDGNLVVWN